ncbi:MAG: Gfo/Idh/MocA family oxidoreductase [Bacteroidota bacterium]
MIKIGLLGVGHLGKIHLKLLREISSFQIIGFFDTDKEKSDKTANEFAVTSFDSLDSLLEQCDAIDIVTPTITHHAFAVKAIKNFKHLFIEKPLCSTTEEAKQIMTLAEEANVKVQVGYVERFNPAFLAAKNYFDKPLFIEAHRLAQFNPRGTDVSVVLDLMIHDIDIVLNVVKSKVKKINASGVAVVSDTPDISNARIEFDNGAVANITASRISIKNMRKMRFFQRNAYISVDFLEKKTEIVRLKNIIGKPDPFAITIDLGNDKGVKQIFFDNPKIESTNAIKMELESFAVSILEDKKTSVTVEDGYHSLDIAYKIIEKMEAK